MISNSKKYKKKNHTPLSSLDSSHRLVNGSKVSRVKATELHA